ncbi:MAG: hypothetical protein M3461_12720 [Pseudomonadota bacterium]|nr:hypothetical protein [Pseudomonadota bacterium]
MRASRTKSLPSHRYNTVQGHRDPQLLRRDATGRQGRAGERRRLFGRARPSHARRIGHVVSPGGLIDRQCLGGFTPSP